MLFASDERCVFPRMFIMSRVALWSLHDAESFYVDCDYLQISCVANL